ncbi:hypothetical protein [Polyangium spumosum]|uniref:Uncharacterized protein n=1 Tax=Polyangium spumosum TaxID=889282 RepID=A0A6N7Q6J9_9BACT|nr:hypothetical protein [Polyangium spumosum]MRG97924.1 hypothetical protein [Polyangium spumosum]
MKNVSKVVAFVLSASAGVWMTGCAAEMADAEDTDSAYANVEHAKGITKGAPGRGMIGQDSQVGGDLGLGGQVAGGVLGKGARIPAQGTQVEQPALGGQVGGEEKAEETQRVGEQDLGQETEDQDLAEAEDAAGQEGETASSQEALSSWWRYGYGGWGGYRRAFGARFLGPHFYGNRFLPYGYGYGYGYYPGAIYGYGGCAGAYPYAYGGCYW